MQNRVKRIIRRLFVGIVGALPKTLFITADIPIIEAFDEFGDRLRRARRIITIQRRFDAFHHLAAFGENIAIHQMLRIGAPLRLHPIRIGIKCEEMIRVPDRLDIQPDRVMNKLALRVKQKLRSAHDGGGHHIPAQRIGAILCKQRLGVHVIFQAFAELAPLIVQHHAVTDAVFKRNSVKQRHGEHEHIIKPAARLRFIFHDEVGRKMRFKPFFVFKRIMHLGIGHRAGFKPAIEDVFHPADRIFRIVGIRRHPLINIRPVKISDFEALTQNSFAISTSPIGRGILVPISIGVSVTRLFLHMWPKKRFQLGNRPKHIQLIIIRIVRTPDRNRAPPKARA